MHIQLRGIHKRYGAVHANRGIDLTVEAGTVHGVLGENGAGKSTLMKILAGLVARTRGEIWLDGEPVELRSPADATRHGIGMLYQDPLDFPPLTSAENFAVGSATAGVKPLAAYAAALGFRLHPERRVEELSLGERRQLELVRLLAQGGRTLILDEPTTGISEPQKYELFTALRALAKGGASVLLVSHKLADVAALCDRVTVLRRGAVAGTMEAPLDPEAVLRLMFDAVPRPAPRRQAPRGPLVLDLCGVSTPGGRTGLANANLAVHGGEVVAVAGVEGSGQEVLLRVAAGLVRPRRGTVRWPTVRGRPGRWSGVTFLPAGRLEEALVAGLTIAEQFALNQPRIPFWRPCRRSRAAAAAGIARYRVQGDPETRVEALSGGNQQRLLVSLIPAHTRLLVLDQPTRGLDLESSHGVWRRLREHLSDGAGIVFSSAELEEILEVSDRVVVCFDGRVVLDLPTDQAEVGRLARAMAGGEGCR